MNGARNPSAQAGADVMTSRRAAKAASRDTGTILSHRAGARYRHPPLGDWDSVHYLPLTFLQLSSRLQAPLLLRGSTAPTGGGPVGTPQIDDHTDRTSSGAGAPWTRIGSGIGGSDARTTRTLDADAPVNSERTATPVSAASASGLAGFRCGAAHLGKDRTASVDRSTNVNARRYWFYTTAPSGSETSVDSQRATRPVTRTGAVAGNSRTSGHSLFARNS